jgi:hypothetical protein
MSSSFIRLHDERLHHRVLNLQRIYHAVCPFKPADDGRKRGMSAKVVQQFLRRKARARLDRSQSLSGHEHRSPVVGLREGARIAKTYFAVCRRNPFLMSRFLYSTEYFLRDLARHGEQEIKTKSVKKISRSPANGELAESELAEWMPAVDKSFSFVIADRIIFTERKQT